jgi:hypothetical protein
MKPHMSHFKAKYGELLQPSFKTDKSKWLWVSLEETVTTSLTKRSREQKVKPTQLRQLAEPVQVKFNVLNTNYKSYKRNLTQ